MAGKIYMYKKFFNWPDGIGMNFFYKKKIKKIPGRKFLFNLKLPKFITTIVVIGNLSLNGKLFLKIIFLIKKSFTLNFLMLPLIIYINYFLNFLTIK